MSRPRLCDPIHAMLSTPFILKIIDQIYLDMFLVCKYIRILKELSSLFWERVST
jgi:hypothetical protein